MLIYSSDLDSDPMTLILELDLHMIVTYLHTKKEVKRSISSSFCLDTQTDRHVKRMRNLYYPACTRNVTSWQHDSYHVTQVSVFSSSLNTHKSLGNWYIRCHYIHSIIFIYLFIYFHFWFIRFINQRALTIMHCPWSSASCIIGVVIGICAHLPLAQD